MSAVASCGPGQRLLEACRAALERQPLLAGHVRVQNFDHTVSSDHAGERKSDAESWIEAPYRDHRPLVADDDFRDPGRYDTDAILARVITFDDGDVGVTNVMLEPGAEISKILAVGLKELLDRHAGDACARPEEDLRGAMVADDLRIHINRIDFEMPPEMYPEAQAVEESAGAKHALVLGAAARDIGKWIGWVRDDQDHSLRRRAHHAWHQVAVDFGILVQQPQPALRIAAVGGAAGLLVDAGGDHHQRRTSETVVVAGADLGAPKDRQAVANIGRHRLRARPRSVDQHDLTRAAARDQGQRASAPDIACSDDSDLHGLPPDWKTRQLPHRKR